jgi:hypothetical protein
MPDRQYRGYRIDIGISAGKKPGTAGFLVLAATLQTPVDIYGAVDGIDIFHCYLIITSK